MSPLPDRDRLAEYATKGVHLALRQAHLAPEEIRARSLARQAMTLEPPTEKHVVVLTPRDWAVHVQWETMIGQALRLRGARVTFITCGGELGLCDRVNTYEGPPVPCTTCRRYVHGLVDAHGFDRVAIRDGWEDHSPSWEELDALGLAELLRVEADDLEYGRLIAVPLRWFLMRSQIDDDPLAALTARRLLRAARRIAQGANAALDHLQPDVVLLLNGLFLFESIMTAICAQREIDVVTYERGFLLDTLLFHRSSPENLYDISPLWSAAQSTPLTGEQDAALDRYLADRRVGRRTNDRYWTRATYDAPSAGTGRLATLFTNLTWDSAVLGQEGGFDSIHDWLTTVIDAFSDHPDDRLIVRIHPAEVKLAGKQTREPLAAFIRQRYPTLPSNVEVIEATDPISSYTLMEATDIGLVLTSTTGLELALHGKPVIVAGHTHYREKGFTLDVNSPEELVATLGRALAKPASVAPSTDLARRYAYHFFFTAPVASPGVEEHIPGLARTTIRDLSELGPGRNDGIDRICDGLLGGGEFLPSLD
ncbi:MAG: hypothetical protein JWO37_1548 [Acidimicrobiales bacterium]|jgi:hypothetical protein|nr:hypothetical protein [Acidimicrobiales bacterium]